jgi:hypothetical protein
MLRNEWISLRTISLGACGAADVRDCVNAGTADCTSDSVCSSASAVISKPSSSLRLASTIALSPRASRARRSACRLVGAVNFLGANVFVSAEMLKPILQWFQ